MHCRCSGRSSATRGSSPYCGQSTRETTSSVAVQKACCGASYARTRQDEKGRGTRCCSCTTPTGKLRTRCRTSSTTTREPAGNSRPWGSCWLTSTPSRRSSPMGGAPRRSLSVVVQTDSQDGHAQGIEGLGVRVPQPSRQSRYVPEQVPGLDDLEGKLHPRRISGTRRTSRSIYSSESAPNSSTRRCSTDITPSREPALN